MWCKVNQVGGADLVGEAGGFLEVVASAELGDIPSQAKRVPKRHGSQIHCEPGANCGDIERSIRQESSKTMKLKGLWNTGGYCLSNKACTTARKGEKSFSLLAVWKRVGRKSWKKLSSLRAAERLRKHRFFRPVKWTKLKEEIGFLP
jgi:hypothetical protein